VSNVIEKRIELAAPLSRVWRALTTSSEIAVWFRVAIEGPLTPGGEPKRRSQGAEQECPAIGRCLNCGGCGVAHLGVAHRLV